MADIVVVGVDGSATAERAAQAAGELAKGLGCELVTICAFEKDEVERIDVPGEELIYSTAAHATQIAEEAALAQRLAFPGLVATARSVFGKPADALLQIADEVEAKVIVVGNKRVQGVASVLGSIARSVAQQAKCDVYVAHTHPRG